MSEIVDEDEFDEEDVIIYSIQISKITYSSLCRVEDNIARYAEEKRVKLTQQMRSTRRIRDG